MLNVRQNAAHDKCAVTAMPPPVAIVGQRRPSSPWPGSYFGVRVHREVAGRENWGHDGDGLHTPATFILARNARGLLPLTFPVLGFLSGAGLSAIVGSLR